MNIDFEHDIQKRETAAKFIQATDQLLNELGTDQVSIRKIAREAGYHSSTLYLYFNDLDELILLATMKYFNEYEEALAEYSQQCETDAYPYFINIWELFMDSAFRHPFTFRNFFFGKHRNRVNEIVELYYQIFPEQKRRYSGIIEAMFAGRSLHDRNMRILEPLATEKQMIPEDKLDLINHIMISCFKDALERCCDSDPQSDRQPYKDEMMDIIEYVIT